MSDKLNIPSFEVSKQQQIPHNKIFPHQPESFFVSDSVKGVLNDEVQDNAVSELIKSFVQVFIEIKSPEQLMLAGVLQSISQQNDIIKRSSIKFKTGLADARDFIVKFINAKNEIILISLALNDEKLCSSGEIINVDIQDIDYSKNLANLTIVFENSYCNE